MSLLKKIAIAIGVIIAIIIIVGIALGGFVIYQITTPPTKFTVKSIEIVDYDGYPAIKIVFETNKYPITFHLLTPEGKEIWTYTATEPEKVVYLYLVPGGLHANIVGRNRYLIEAYYLNKEIWSKEITIKGVIPSVKIEKIIPEIDLTTLTLKKIIIKVTNLGDVPLYLDPLLGTIRLYLDGEKEPITIEGGNATILPGTAKIVTLETMTGIDYDKLDKRHVIEIVIADKFKFNYTIPPAKISLKVGSIKFTEFLGTKYVDNATVTITNNWVFPINVKWIRILINGEEYSALFSWLPETEQVVNPGETVTYTLKFPAYTAKVGSTVEFYIGSTKIASITIK